MKKLLASIVLFLTTHTVNAQLLCDPDCSLTLEFSNGGEVVATGPMDIIFGSGGELLLGAGGTVNTAVQPASLDFSSGGTLSLAAGESISFGSAGRLFTSLGGNVDAGNYSITASSITIDNSNGSSVTLNGNLDVSGSLVINTASIILDSNIVMNTIDINEVGIGSGVTLSGNGSFTNLSGDTIDIDGTVFMIDTGLVNFNELSTIISLSPQLGMGDINLADVNQLDSLELLQGLTLDTSDGNQCVVDGEVCKTEDGQEYILTDGKLVLKKTGSGSDAEARTSSGTLHLWSLVVMTVVLVGFRKV